MPSPNIEKDRRLSTRCGPIRWLHIGRRNGRWIVSGLMLLLSGWPAATVFSDSNPYEEGLAALHAGNYRQAIENFNYTLETIPHDYEALSNRAVAWYYLEDYDRAMADATRALELNPYYAVGANQLAWMLATCPDRRYRDGKRAVALAEAVVRRFPEANFMDTLAAAYAEAGNVEAAVHIQRMAVQEIKKGGASGKKVSFEKRLNAYGASAADSRGTMVRQSPPPVAADTGAAAAGSDDISGAPDVIPATVRAAVSTTDSRRIAENRAASDHSPRYSVHLLSCRNERWAAEKAAELAGGSHPAFVLRIRMNNDPRPWFRVGVGAFESTAEAKGYAGALKAQGHEWANVIRLPADAKMSE